MEGVLCPATVSCRVRQGRDDLQQLHDRAGPAVRHQHRHGVGMRGADVRELDVQPVDLGDELRQSVDLRLGLAPVVPGAPVLDERAELCQLGALRPVADRLPIRPPRLLHAPSKLVELLLRDPDAKGTDSGTSPRVARGGGARRRRPVRRCLRLTGQAHLRDGDGTRGKAQEAATTGVTASSVVGHTHKTSVPRTSDSSFRDGLGRESWRRLDGTPGASPVEAVMIVACV